MGVGVAVAVGAAHVFDPAGPVHGHPAGQSVLVLHESPQARGVVGLGEAVGVGVETASQVPLVEHTGHAVTH